MLRTTLLLLPVIAVAQSPRMSREEMEHFLKTAPIVEMRPLGPGGTHSKRAVLDDGKMKHDAAIQTVNITKAEFEAGPGKERDTYLFNLAAYELDKILGLNMMPPAVERNVAGQPASVTWWVDNSWMTEGVRIREKLTPPDQEAWYKQMLVVRVFDQLVANTDRNLMNLLITKDWKLWMVDHTRAFRTVTTLLNEGNLTKCDRKLLLHLRKLDKNELTRTLKAFLNTEQIESLMVRRDAMVKLFERLIAQKGEQAVLYDWL